MKRRLYIMMKPMKKTIATLCMVITILIGSTSTCFAAVCPNSPDDVHHFNKMNIIAGNTEYYDHTYLFGYDENNKPIYDTCRVTIITSYWHYVCQFCGLQKPNDPVHESVVTTHSANHN